MHSRSISVSSFQLHAWVNSYWVIKHQLFQFMVLQISPKYASLFKFKQTSFHQLSLKASQKSAIFSANTFQRRPICFFFRSATFQLFPRIAFLSSQEREQRYFIFWSTPGAQFCLVRLAIHCGSQQVGRGTWLSFLILHGFKLLYLLPQSMLYKGSKMMMVVVMMLLTVVMMTTWSMRYTPPR